MCPPSISPMVSAIPAPPMPRLLALHASSTSRHTTAALSRAVRSRRCPAIQYTGPRGVASSFSMTIVGARYAVTGCPFRRCSSPSGVRARDGLLPRQQCARQALRSRAGNRMGPHRDHAERRAHPPGRADDAGRGFSLTTPRLSAAPVAPAASPATGTPSPPRASAPHGRRGSRAVGRPC